jgi:hypothetical protein
MAIGPQALANAILRCTRGGETITAADRWRHANACRGGVMPPTVIAEIQRRLPAIPWREPIRVQFTCDDKPLYGCRLCILIFGLRYGDRGRLFADEIDALSHTCQHAENVVRFERAR